MNDKVKISREEARNNALEMLKEARKDYKSGQLVRITNYMNAYNTSRFIVDDVMEIVTTHEPTMNDVNGLYKKLYIRNKSTRAGIKPVAEKKYDFVPPRRNAFVDTEKSKSGKITNYLFSLQITAAVICFLLVVIITLQILSLV